MKKYFLDTYGCAANKSDAERIRRILQDADYVQSNDLGQADLVIYNTCGVKDPTERKIIKELKKSEQLQKKTIITGCLPNISLSAIKKANPNYSAIIDTKSTHLFGTVLKRIEQGEMHIDLFANNRFSALEKIDIIPLSYNPQIGILTINEGCDGNCTFCGTKLARGKTLSHPPHKLIKQAELMLRNGSQELWITSQDSGAYRYEENGKIWEVPELIEAICLLPYRFRLRLGMINPDHILRLHFQRTENKLFDVISRYSQIYQFLHIPIQSGNDRILELMKRRHTVAEFKKIVIEIKKRFPKLTISTDIIAGFPSETEEDFNETIELIKWFRPPVLNVSRYGARPGTVASKMRGQIHERISKERTRKLMKIWEVIALEENSAWLNWEGQAFINEKGNRDTLAGDKTVIGRNYAYKPIIIEADENFIGKFVSVKIKGTKTHYLLGEINNNSFQSEDQILTVKEYSM
jgi:MiaB-like tRNA modifying enzyme